MAPRSKIIVRNFPPGFTDDQFRELVTPWTEAADYVHFDQGKKPKPLSTKPVIFGRGYLNFRDSESLLDACQRLSGHHIVDPDGFEGVLQASLAPFQGIPGQSQHDPLQGTIESSPEWTTFLSDLESTAHPTAIPIDKQTEVMLAKERELNPWKYEKGLAKQTPLLVYLKKQAGAEISVKGLLSTTGGGGGGGKSKAKKKKKKKKGSNANFVDDSPFTQEVSDFIYELPPKPTSSVPVPKTKPSSTAKSTLKGQMDCVVASPEIWSAPDRATQPNMQQPSLQSKQPAPKPKPRPKPKAKSVVEPAPQAPTVPFKIMVRSPDAKPLVEPKVVSTKPKDKPSKTASVGPSAPGSTTITYSTANRTANQYVSKASQSRNAPAHPSE